MTMRIWMMSVVALVLLAGGWMAGVASTSRASQRSAQSEPAWSIPTTMVSVTDQGKLFHDPSCPLIHGPAHLESGRQAILDGYTPCTRCLKAD